jgi:hypothetical protein
MNQVEEEFWAAMDLLFLGFVTYQAWKWVTK